MTNQPKWIEEGREPTPIEWLEWFSTQENEDAFKVIDQVIRDRKISSNCHLHDHSGRINHMDEWIKKNQPETELPDMSKEEMIEELLNSQREFLLELNEHGLHHLVIENRVHIYKTKMMKSIGEGESNMSLGKFLKNREETGHAHEKGFL